MIALTPEPGITIPALAFVPEGGASKKRAVLWLNAAGKAADAAEGGAIEKIVREGTLVLAIDPRGWGESATEAKAEMRALLVGKTLAGMQTGDVLHAFEFLRARPDVDASNIAVIGKGNGGVLALFAAALEPRIARVACENSPQSYLEIVQARQHTGILGIVIPGVLQDFDLPDVVASLRPRPVWIATEPGPNYAAWLRR
jgi:dienelactone hydrolase